MKITKLDDNDSLFGEQQQKERQLLYKRMRYLVIIFFAVFSVMLVRLFFLQVIRTDEYASISDKNRLRIVSQPAARGNIYDCNGVTLADSEPVFAIGIVSSEVLKSEIPALAANLAAILHDPELNEEAIEQLLKEQTLTYQPTIIKRYPYEGNESLLTSLEENRSKLPGLEIITEPQRHYPLGTLAGHILGTVGLISQDELDLVKNNGYLINDWIGKTGLEKTMESYADTEGKEIGLRGTHGVQKVEVNARHQPVEVLENQPSVQGNSLALTIDANLQKVLEDSLAQTIAKVQESFPKAQGGAGVVVNVKTGAVLAMASYPAINPNDFAVGLTTEQSEYYWDAKLRPTLNRAISAAYPVGSTFKPITAAAAFSTDEIDPSFTVTCGPAMWRKPRASCPAAHGVVDLKKAMAKSCNAYFQEVALLTGPERFYEIASQLGLGQLTGIELSSEVKGVLPSPEWKAKNFTGWEETWHNYDTFYMSIGQGYNLDTPLQMAMAIATIANDGVRMKPYLVQQVSDVYNSVLYTAQPEKAAEVDIKQDRLQLVQEAMLAVTQQGGTAWSLFKDFPFTVAAKTGTAQSGLVGDDPSKDYHGWFVAFAPYDDPEIAFAGIIEYGYHGSTSAGYVCRDVFRQYFGLNDAVKQKTLTDNPYTAID